MRSTYLVGVSARLFNITTNAKETSEVVQLHRDMVNLAFVLGIICLPRKRLKAITQSLRRPDATANAKYTVIHG